MVDTLGERDGKRIAFEGRAVLTALRRDRRELHAAALDGCRGLRAAESLINESAQRRLIRAIGRRESPGSLMDHAKAEASIGSAGHGLHRAILHADRFVLSFDGSRVRV